jgi:Flp pilus assembly protein TadD
VRGGRHREPARRIVRLGISRGALLLFCGCLTAGHAGWAVAASIPQEKDRNRASTLATLAAEPLRGLRAAAAGLLLQAPDGGALPVAPLLVGIDVERDVLGVPDEVSSDTSGSPEPRRALIVSFLLEVAGDALAAGAPTDAGEAAAENRRVEIYAYLLGSGGEVLGHRASVISLAGLAPGPASEEGVEEGLRIAGSLRAEIERTQPDRLRLLVLDPASNRHGLASVPIDLRTAALWPPPSFASEGAWRVVDLGARDIVGARSARPVLFAGRRHAFDLSPSESDGAARQASDEPPRRNLRVALRPARENDRTLPRHTLLETSARRTPGPAQTVDVELPGNQPPGAYQLEVTFDQEGAAVATRPIEVWIAAEMLAEAEALAWPSLLRLDSLPTSRTDTTDARGPRADAQTARYFAHLIQADSNEASSLDGLLELLTVPGGSTEASRRVLTAIARGAVRLVEDSDRVRTSSWEIVVPLLEHHRRAFLRGSSGGRSMAALNNLDAAEILARLFPPGDLELEGRTLIADALALGARDCEVLGLTQRTSRLLLAALEVDPGHRSSLELLAIHRERSGDLAGAVEAVERLLRDDPRNRELRLRQAVLAHRRGRLRTADARARDLVAERAGDWIEELALEIRGSIALGQGDVSAAVGLLRNAAAEHPDNQRLRILYASALERSGGQVASDAVLSQAELLEPVGPSPRYRYAQPVASGIVDSQRRLAAALPLLRAQLVAAATRQVSRNRDHPTTQ